MFWGWMWRSCFFPHLSYFKYSLSLPKEQILKAKMAVIQVINNPFSWHIFQTFTAFAFPSWISSSKIRLIQRSNQKNTRHKDKKKAFIRGHGFQEGKKKNTGNLKVWWTDRLLGRKSQQVAQANSHEKLLYQVQLLWRMRLILSPGQ